MICFLFSKLEEYPKMQRKVFIVISSTMTAFILLCGLFIVQGGNSCRIERYNAETILFITTCSRAAQVAENYYNSIVTGDFADAFVNVAYYTRSSNPKPSISYHLVEERWVQRVQALKVEGTYIVDVESIKVYTDDGYPMGVARLVIHENGVEKTIDQIIHFNRMEERGPWKIRALDSENSSLQELDEVLSGKELI